MHVSFYAAFRIQLLEGRVSERLTVMCTFAEGGEGAHGIAYPEVQGVADAVFV